MKLSSAPAPKLKLSLLGATNPKYTKTLKAVSAFLIFDFKEAADVMKDIERPEWLYDRSKLREEHFRPEDSVQVKDDLH